MKCQCGIRHGVECLFDRWCWAARLGSQPRASKIIHAKLSNITLLSPKVVRYGREFSNMEEQRLSERQALRSVGSTECHLTPFFFVLTAAVFSPRRILVSMPPSSIFETNNHTPTSIGGEMKDQMRIELRCSLQIHALEQKINRYSTTRRSNAGILLIDSRQLAHGEDVRSRRSL